ncbi:hypothetical protein EVA_21336 [gut metagenome]|uniref:Uncharacterized protein n=1 Tax=gut metagenome TaxID=749906 RepID=J9FLU1_9ZZZZ
MKIDSSHKKRVCFIDRKTIKKGRIVQISYCLFLHPALKHSLVTPTLMLLILSLFSNLRPIFLGDMKDISNLLLI